MQVPRKCDIILLSREYYIVSSTLYSFYDSATVVSRGGFFFIPQAGRRIQHLGYSCECVGSLSDLCGTYNVKDLVLLRGLHTNNFCLI